MERQSILFSAIFLVFFVVHLAPAGPTLPNTGEAGIGFVETNYTLTYALNLTDEPEAMTAYGITPNPKWVTPPAGSQWISPLTGPSGYFFYKLDFSISGMTSISGRWATDNYGEIFLNGETTGITRGMEDFGSLADFSITNGFTGDDTLVFVVRNAWPSATGLLVTDLTPTIIPAPSAILLGSIGVGLITWLRRRRTL